jgi:hypothetical protein
MLKPNLLNFLYIHREEIFALVLSVKSQSLACNYNIFRVLKYCNSVYCKVHTFIKKVGKNNIGAPKNAKYVSNQRRLTI